MEEGAVFCLDADPNAAFERLFGPCIPPQPFLGLDVGRQPGHIYIMEERDRFRHHFHDTVRFLSLLQPRKAGPSPGLEYGWYRALERRNKRRRW